jgi:hypothetical protein
MLINLLPDFFTVLNSTDRTTAYQRYFDTHRRLLEAYWHNYVLDPDSPHFTDVVRGVVHADRSDLRAMLERTDVVTVAREIGERCTTLLDADVDIDVVLMVGVGAANAGELVTDGKGIAFVCLEHFTGVANPETQGLGLDPALIPLWLSHEIAHAVRYTSPGSRCELRRLIDEADGYYSYWETGRRATLGELLVNEGLAVAMARAASPGHADWEYFGYGRRQYARIRELEPVLGRGVVEDVEDAGLGLRLRYLSDGLSDDARTTVHGILPERSGYYLGYRMVERAVAEHGLSWAIRASTEEILGLGTRDSGLATAEGVRVLPPRAVTSPESPVPSPESLPHAERAEEPVEDVLDAHRADQLFERPGGGTEMDGGDARRQLAGAPRLIEERDLVTSPLDGTPVTFACEQWDIAGELAVPLVQHASDRRDQLAEPRPGCGAHRDGVRSGRRCRRRTIVRR